MNNVALIQQHLRRHGPAQAFLRSLLFDALKQIEHMREALKPFHNKVHGWGIPGCAYCTATANHERIGRQMYALRELPPRRLLS